MPAPERAEILRRVREAFLEHGRGFVIIFEDREEPRYGLFDDLRTSLPDEAEAATILMAVEKAVVAYDSKTEAVVIDERAEGIFVLIRSEIETRVAGEFFWTKPT